jgi:tRNA1(Val) A37 N6-methylase TrmN6
LLLIDFVLAQSRKLGRVCDLGTGVGVIGLGLARKDEQAKVTLVELQPQLAELARRNAAENRLASRVQVVELDLADVRASKQRLAGACFDWVVSNPPYRALGRGSPNPLNEEALARHELRLTLADVVRESRRLLVPGGRAAWIYPAERLPALLIACDQERLRPLRLRLVHDRVGEPAARLLLEARKGARGTLQIAPPLFLRDAQGAYTREAQQLLGDL